MPVVCSEINAPDVASTGVVTVEVIFVNEDAPVFDFSSYYFSISEDVSTLSYVGTVQATDSDVGSFGELSYSIVGGNPDKFFIEASTGRIGVLTSLDRETVDFYTLTVSAVDGGTSASNSSRLIGTTLVMVQVEDANDNIPTPEELSYVESITTGHLIHSAVLSVVCSDNDLADAGAIQYSLDPFSVPFSIQTNGTILLDEMQTDQTVYTFNVVCTDQGVPPLSSFALVTVIVDYVELEAPMFDRQYYNVTVSENEPIQTTILQVHATPSDASIDVGYQLQSGNDRNQFQVNPSTGEIIIRNFLDANEQQHYTLVVKATNTGRTPLSSFATVYVTVVDINNHSPSFSSPFYAASVTETASLLTPVTRITCVDEDISAVIAYSIVDGQGHPPKFTITEDGVIATIGEIDYEEATLYNLIVECSDGGESPLTASATVRVEINPVNEYLPIFLDEQYEFTAEENSFGSEIGDLHAVDGDAGSQGEIAYLLQDPGNFSVVFVGPSTGEVLMSNNLDYETQSFWNLTVIAQDGAGAASFVPLLISVINVNDVLPIVTPAISIAVIPHDTPAGFPVQTYSCTDGDHSSTSLSITNGNHLGYFTLNSLSQLIWNGMAEDLLASIVVSLSLECVDNEAMEQSVLAYIAVTIRVGDLLPPEFSLTMYDVDIPEDSEVGVSILTVNATRDDHEIEYILDDLFNSLPFSLNSSTGVISLTSRLNRENTSHYAFPVQARDTQTSAISTTLVSITVLDINDNFPVISPRMQLFSLSENMPTGIPFTVFQCSDNDEGNNADIVFSLMPSDSFTISQGGQVSLSRSLNFEEQLHHNISVLCSDQGLPPKSDAAILIIEVIGANEHSPVFSMPTYNFSMSEGAVLGTLVGVVSATDKDQGMDGQLQYNVVGGNGVPYFSVNSNGEIYTSSLSTNATEATSLDLVVEASDGRYSAITVVSVSITDVNEPPLFSGNDLVLWSTNAPVSETIIEVLCYDTDTPLNSNLTLSLLANPSNLPVSLTSRGSVGITTGHIVADGAIPAGVYSLSLLCFDGALNTTTDITLRVEGMNNPPVFQHDDLVLALLETTVPGTLLIAANATDPEGTDITYGISSGTGLGTFIIDSVTGQISLALSLDYEITQNYFFTVTAADSSRFDSQLNTVGVFVFVVNVNDVPPSLTPSDTIILTLSENSPPQTQIQTFECRDPEGGMTSLSLAYGNGVSPFGINPQGVVILLTGDIDYEVEMEYQLTVTCTDEAFTGGDVRFQESSILIVHITPENNYSPEFVSESFIEVSEDTAIGLEIGMVQAIDEDNRTSAIITYTLLSHLDTFTLGFESAICIVVVEDYDP